MAHVKRQDWELDGHMGAVRKGRGETYSVAMAAMVDAQWIYLTKKQWFLFFRFDREVW